MVSRHDTRYLPADQLKRRVRAELSKLGKVEKVELEGPFVVAYVSNLPDFLDSGGALGEIAKALKKKIIIRAAKPILSPQEAKRKIKELIPERAEIVDMEFVEETGEVYILAKRTGYVVGKAGSSINEVLKATGWRPVVMRAPTMQSTFLNILYNLLIEGAHERKKNLRRIAKRIFRDPVPLGRGLTVTFLGGAREVGRSSLLVRTGESSVLLDAGIGVGGGDFFPRYDLPDLDLDELDAVIVTHAHLDHSGALPLLFKYGYRGPVYVTRPTRDLITLLLYDYINVSMRTGKFPYFGEREIRLLINHMIALDYGETVDISPDIKLTFYNAGHILGSALAHLNVLSARHNILYTGDFRYRDTKLLSRAHTKFPRVETVIMETTYSGEGDVMPPLQEAERQLISIIEETVAKGGKVLIPALSVGRAQEVMLSLVDAFSKGELPDIPVYIDGMIYDATAIHTAYPDYMSDYMKSKVFKEDVDPFTEPHITPVSSREDREAIVEGGPAIILAPSGMLAGGPSVEYLSMLADDERNAVVLVSYQPPGTLGRALKEGAKEITVTRNGAPTRVRVRACVCSVEGFSAHADRVQLLSWMGRVSPRPRRFILVHGEERKIASFRPIAERTFRGQAAVLAPRVSERLSLA
ncbi:MAG TPA: beta-CASP ribonuclease aCPSF1 [Candidatus Korarchaeota archaeon]|nr:beta-CASP ribonuclease aCPSF1 [Candidatus Korarchaeota archaeon]